MEKEINNLVEIYLSNGVNLQRKQPLFITVPKEQAEIGQKIKKLAQNKFESEVFLYTKDVYSELVDGFEYDHDKYLDKIKKVYDNKIFFLNKGAAFLEIRPGVEPASCKNQKYYDDLIKLDNSLQKDFRIIKRKIGNIVSCKTVIPTKYWASTIFENQEDSYEKLWEAYNAITLSKFDNPVDLWNKRIDKIQHYVNYLDKKQYNKLLFFDNKSSLSVELILNHKWTGGCEINDYGVRYMPNFPTQEVFSAPKKKGMNGHFKNSKPLWFQNSEINDFSLVFKEGEVVEYSSEDNKKTLKSIIDYDENSKYVGEIAILPGITEISKTGVLYNNTLLDENAACHLALGCAYQCSYNGKVDFNEQDYNKHDMNFSGIHVDVMFGSEKINIIGIDSTGKKENIIINGEWVI